MKKFKFTFSNSDTDKFLNDTDYPDNMVSVRNDVLYLPLSIFIFKNIRADKTLIEYHIMNPLSPINRIIEYKIGVINSKYYEENIFQDIVESVGFEFSLDDFEIIPRIYDKRHKV